MSITNKEFTENTENMLITCRVLTWLLKAVPEKQQKGLDFSTLDDSSQLN